jgi:hypothetical protein
MDRSGRTGLRALVRALVAVAVLALGLGPGVEAIAGPTAPAAAGGPQVVVTPDHVHDGQLVGVDISGFGAGFGSTLECAVSATVDPTFYTLDAGCQMLAGPYTGGGPPAHEDVTVDASFTVFNASRTVVCASEPGGCVVGVIIGAIPEPGQPFASAFAPITFVPPPEVSLTPSSGLLDGQPMTLSASNLSPGATYRVQHCKASACHTGQAVRAADDGTLSLAVPAQQQFTANGRPVVCRTACSVRVLEPAGGEIGRRPYAMAAGSLTVVPDTGLADGQAVQVSGSDLMPGYSGRPILGFPTGGWTLTQCDRALLDHLSLSGALTSCSTAPPTLAVDVTDSSFAATLEAPATITKILGGTTDCAASPGACVVGLVRFEQDGSFSAHLEPVSFAVPG